MRRLLLVLMSMLFVSAMAQDVLITRGGDEIQCKVLEIGKSEVKFKRWSNLEGPVMAEKKSNIFMIKYENGEKEMIKAEETAATTSSLTTPALSFTPTVETEKELIPLSNNYMEYDKRGLSGIKIWGHKQTREQAQKIFTNDWTGFNKARKQEKGGTICIIVGSATIGYGLACTVMHIVSSKNYNYDVRNEVESAIKAKANYDEEKDRLYNEKVKFYNEYQQAVKEYEATFDMYSDAYYKMRSAENLMNKSETLYNHFIEKHHWNDGTRSHLSCRNNHDHATYFDYYDYHNEINDDKVWKKTSVFPMIGGLTCGTAALIIGIIKQKRGKAEVTRIINQYNEEYEKTNKSSMRKPEFNIGTNGNGLSFTLNF